MWVVQFESADGIGISQRCYQKYYFTYFMDVFEARVYILRANLETKLQQFRMSDDGGQD